MKTVHIVGRKNNGKTTLMVELIQAFTALGLKVASIKHSPHPHEPDTPGKDSHQHRLAGAQTTAFVTPEVLATYTPITDTRSFYEDLAPLHSDIDLLLVEGDLHGPGLIYEVYRAEVKKDLLATEHSQIQGLITDDEINLDLPCFPRHPIDHFVKHLLETLELPGR